MTQSTLHQIQQCIYDSLLSTKYMTSIAVFHWNRLTVHTLVAVTVYPVNVWSRIENWGFHCGATRSSPSPPRRSSLFIAQFFSMISSWCVLNVRDSWRLKLRSKKHAELCPWHLIFYAARFDYLLRFSVPNLIVFILLFVKNKSDFCLMLLLNAGFVLLLLPPCLFNLRSTPYWIVSRQNWTLTGSLEKKTALFQTFKSLFIMFLSDLNRVLCLLTVVSHIGKTQQSQRVVWFLSQ